VPQPLWSRSYETFGEDPYLVARMGEAIIQGAPTAAAGNVLVVMLMDKCRELSWSCGYKMQEGWSWSALAHGGLTGAHRPAGGG
jgi:hypothetical protein